MVNDPVVNIVPCQISSPLYLQVKTGSSGSQMISLREHKASIPEIDYSLPLVLLTFHPGFSAGSYENRDYFELLTPLLFASCAGQFRLRIFTVNHPGQDLPPKGKIRRMHTQQYSIKEQPAMIIPALRWLLQREFADEDPVYLVSYGHSMGGLALAQCDLQQLAGELAHQGRHVQPQKVLSAPALVLSREAKWNLRPLNALNTLKKTVGRLPLYEQVATGLYRGLAPTLHRFSANTFSLNPDDTFLNFRRQNPFLLLQHGRELLQQQLEPQQLCQLVDGSHVFVYSGDRMIDSPALLSAISYAKQENAAVETHIIKSMHNAERENPRAVAQQLQDIIQNMLPA